MAPDPFQYQDDFENPYAPPDSTFVRESTPTQFGSIPFNVVDLFNWTWALYQERMGLCISIIWGVVAINVGISVVANILLALLGSAVRDAVIIVIAQIAITFGSYVVQFWLNAGTNLAFLGIVRRQRVAFEDVFKAGQYVLTIILAWVVMVVCVAGPLVLAMLGIAAIAPFVRDQLSIVPIVLAVVLVATLVVIAVYLSIRLSQYPFVVLDRNAGVIESLQMSWFLTKNKVLTLILVYLLFTSIIVAGMLACLVGLVFAIPLASLFLAVTYVALTGQPPTPELQFLDEWDEDIWKDQG